jgi:hypothetical protein
MPVLARQGLINHHKHLLEKKTLDNFLAAPRFIKDAEQDEPQQESET